MKIELLAQKIALFAIALVCLYATMLLTFNFIAARNQHTIDRISLFEMRIQRVKPFLGNETSIGYLFARSYQAAQARNFTLLPLGSRSAEQGEESGRGSLVNYSLRPLGIFLGLSKETRLMITDFLDHPPQAPAFIKLREWEYTLVHDFGGGLSLYKRKE